MASPNDLQAVANIPMYRRTVWNNVINSPNILMALHTKGGIQKGVGTQCTWPVEAGLPTTYAADTFADMTSKITIQKHHVQATLDRFNLVTPLAVDNVTLSENDGEGGLYDLLATTVPSMYKAHLILDPGCIGWWFFHGDGTVDGDDGTAPYIGSGLETCHGLRSIFPSTSSAASGTKIASYNGSATYAGLTLGADQDVDNPVGDAWKGVQINTKASWITNKVSSVTGYATNTFNEKTFPEIMRRAVRETTRSQSDSMYQPDWVIHDGNHFDVAAAFFEGKQMGYVTPGAPGAGPWKFGVMDNNQTMYHNGLLHVRDVHCQANTSYVINWDQVWFEYVQLKGKTLDIWEGKKDGGNGKLERFTKLTQGYIFDRAGEGTKLNITTRFQFKFNPRYHACIRDFTA